jgi:hypothetical protein
MAAMTGTRDTEARSDHGEYKGKANAKLGIEQGSGKTGLEMSGNRQLEPVGR